MIKAVSFLAGWLVAPGLALAADMFVNVSNLSNYSGGLMGGCAIKVSPIDAIADQAGYANGTGDGQCRRGFISFDCDGGAISKAEAARFVSASQLAQVTGNRLYVVVNPNQKYNGYCTATRVDNLPN